MIPFSDRPSPKADLQAIWEWLHRMNERSEHDDRTDADYSALAAVPVEAERPPAKPVVDTRPTITFHEKRAIFRGFYLRGLGKADAWAEVCRCLEAENASREFRRLVARMIEGNILHANGKVPSGLDRQDTLRQRTLYANLLERYYADLGRLNHIPLAERLVAFDLCLEFHDAVAPGEVTDQKAFADSLADFEKQVKSICDPHRGTNKAAKGVGAEVLAAAHAAKIIPQE